MIPIVTINYNGCKDTIELLDSLIESGESYNLILVDNCSPNKDDTELLLKILSQRFQQRIISDYFDEKVSCIIQYRINNSSMITFMQSINNFGFSGGTNIGLRYAMTNQKNEKYCCILNNDTIVTPGFITKIVNQMNIKGFAAAMGTILFYGYEQKYVWSTGGYFNWLKGECSHIQKNSIFVKDDRPYVERQFVSGCFTIFKSDKLSEIGLLDEDYFFAGEEYQYSVDLVKKGYKLAWIPESIIYHKSILEQGNGSSHKIADLCWQYNAYMVKIVFINKNKGTAFRLFWHQLFKAHINKTVRKKLISNNICSKEQFRLFKNALFMNIKKKSFTQNDFISFKTMIAGMGC